MLAGLRNVCNNTDLPRFLFKIPVSSLCRLFHKQNWRDIIEFSRSTNYTGGKVLYALQFTYISVRSVRPDSRAVN